jgi:hypothetical protein
MQADVIFDAMRPIILAATGIPECLKTEPNAPAPSGEYCTVSVYSNISQRGQAIVYKENQAGALININAVPQAVSEVSINFYRGDAVEYAARILQANKRPSVSEALYAASLGWQRAGPINKLTALQGPRFESRAQVSIFLWHEVIFPETAEDANTIEQVPYTIRGLPGE